ncbi:MAG: polysaccharide biosynthesis/export family protein, partial [Deltaproteobacteria bacterium]|nr:polysaccharide biosynthesis/export family protein [Deltaproteobacteria bacterium]
MKFWPFDEIPCFLSPKAAIGLSLVLLFGAACTTPVPAPTQDKGHQTYRVGASDVLHIVVLPDPQVERDVTVRFDGKISMDLIGDVDAAGHTTEEIAASIQKSIAKFKRDARVTVYLVDTQATQV